ncbi:MAG TPA: saccharopine dehydrogenase [Flavobacteriales bacterium]|jgi:saccharopine dehydrogenase (NAD+, L-glutamate forming)|nr:saccharopine dehydrogenase [Flavobacteriales bacterium]
MKKILLIGAGKSTSSLMAYLKDKAATEDLDVTIVDKNLSLAQKIVGDNSRFHLKTLDIFNDIIRGELIQNTDLVISMLPARFHMQVALDALKLGKHMVTASYISDELKALDEDVKAKGLVFMNEIGLDPGIDHMSAMHIMDQIKAKGGQMILFESFTGGLVAPESDDNLWHYKFTWNPRNVVLAGQGGVSKFLHAGEYKYIPYHRLFRRTEFFNIDGYGRFEAYPNRDSLKYQKIYGLDNVGTLYRGTIRRVGFSRAWNVFVQLGMTDDSYIMENSENLTKRDFVNAFLPYSPTDSVELKLRQYLKIDQDDELWLKLEELDLFEGKTKIGLKNATPAQMLQKILEDKWTLKPEDKDMIVMYHKFGYKINGENKQIDSQLVVKGEDQTFTAMAKTVGLPVAIAAIKILNGEIKTPGVQLPINKEIYEPILKELKTYGIIFKDKVVPFQCYNPNKVIG